MVTVGQRLPVLGVLAVQGRPGMTPVAQVGVAVGRFSIRQGRPVLPGRILLFWLRRRCNRNQPKVKAGPRDEIFSQGFRLLTFPGRFLLLLLIVLLTFPPFL